MNVSDTQPFEGECIEWDGGHSSAGYGQQWINGKTEYTHRVAYTEAKGPIPDGLQIDHLCRNRGCMNPDHLEAVTPYENKRRSPFFHENQHTRKTHCPYGHPYDKENTYYRPEGWRGCKVCRRRRTREWRERNRT